MNKVNETLEQRGRLIEQMKTLSADNPDGFDAETQVKYDALDGAQQKYKDTADRLHREAELDSEMNAPISDGSRLPSQIAPVAKPREGEEYKNALNSYIRTGRYSNALEVGTNSEGGFITHDDFDSRFREIRDDYNALRPFVDVITTSGDHNIRVESTVGTSTWTDEEAAYTESDPAFGNVTLNAYKLGRIVKVSEELLQDADFDIEGYLASNFGRSTGIAEEAAFINGSGTLQPTGIISGATSVARTESPNQATITATTLMDAFYGLGRQYRQNARWILADDSIKDVRLITDSNDNYVWQPGLQVGQPDRILGKEFIDSAQMPSAGESPLQSPVVFGDLSNYTVADRTSFSIQRLNELYAANGYVGFRGWSRVDGEVVQAAGIVKIAAF